MLHRGVAVLVGLFLLVLAALRAEDEPSRPGPIGQGFVLPNGWTITPAGRQVVLTDLPLNILPLADNKHVLIATNGYNKHELSLIELASGRVVDKQTVKQSWFGLVATRDQQRLWWSGGGAGMLHYYELKNHRLKRIGADEPPLTKKDNKKRTATEPTVGPKQKPSEPKKMTPFTSGLLCDDGSRTLYSLDINAGTLTALDLDTERTRSAAVGGRPYDVVRSRNGAQLYVSDWSGRAVLAIDAKSLRIMARIAVGEHPNQMVVHPRDDRLFVACALSNCVSVLDTRRGIVTETIVTSLFPRAPEGSTPDALALSPDGETLYVANADNNCIAVIDVAAPGKSMLKGFIPTGWYPTAIAVTPDGQNLLIGVGKGNQTRANPLDKESEKDKEFKSNSDNPGKRKARFPYIGTTLSGALSIVPVPDDKQLAKYTATVYRNCPYSDKLLLASPHPDKTVIPGKPDDPSPIKYVIYIIKENRTYDQVFGDIKVGNGDPSLVMFGEKVTPNHHKLAREFVLLDNLYCNGQVSRDGHPWSTMAYNTDYIARDWHLTYSGRIGVDDDDEGHLSNAPSGYLWDACNRAGLSYRSYGEYGKRVSTGDGGNKMEARVPGLVGHICPDYGVSKVQGKRLRDPENIATFLKEYRVFEEEDRMPRFIIMSLGEDHTTGTTPDTYTPQACVASNDLALGRVVEAVTKSKYWKETAIFVIEDDAQNGPDHVDAHRTIGLVISPYTKRHSVDSTQYSTVSMVRTIELILGLPPLSQYDAAARPMYAAFSDKADLTPYEHEKARVDLDAKNTKKSYGAERSSRMDFREYDRVDDFELNEILWRSIKGADAPVPPTVRRAIANRPVSRR